MRSSVTEVSLDLLKHHKVIFSSNFSSLFSLFPPLKTLFFPFFLVCEGFGTSLCATHRLSSPGDKIEKGSVSLTALVDSHLCETWSLENQ